MLPELYRLLFEHEQRYWWSRARRDLTLRLCHALRGNGYAPSARALDVGCGTGALVQALGGIATAHGVDESEIALALCRKAGLVRLTRASAERLPFTHSSMDVVTSLDVLEHLHDDVAALREIHRVLRPNGVLVLMVPAFQLLWTDRDDRLGHRRRYHRSELRTKLQIAGFRVLHCRYTNPSLFPILLAAIIGRRLMGENPHVSTDVASVPGPFNEVLYRWVQIENWAAMRVALPFGTTVIAVATAAPAGGEAGCGGGSNEV